MGATESVTLLEVGLTSHMYLHIVVVQVFLYELVNHPISITIQRVSKKRDNIYYMNAT